MKLIASDGIDLFAMVQNTLLNVASKVAFATIRTDAITLNPLRAAYNFPA